MIAQLPAMTRAVLDTTVQGVTGSTTFYAFWAGRWGLAPLWVLGLTAALAAWWGWRRRALAQL